MASHTRFFQRHGSRTPALLILFLIASAVAAYGGEYVWQEAFFVSTVFLLTVTAFAIGVSNELRDVRAQLFAPLLLLAAYSFLQGITPLVFDQTADISFLLPNGYEPVASLWSGLKFAAAACLLALCLIALRQSRALFCNGLLILGTACGIFGIARLLLQDLVPELNQFIVVPELAPGVGFGTFLNQNHFALMMLMTLGLAIGLLFDGKIFRTKKLPLAIASLTAWLAIVLTASRGGIIGSFVVVGTFMLFRVGSAVARSRRDNTAATVYLRSLSKSFASSILILVLLGVGVFLVGQGRIMQRFAELPYQVEGAAGGAFRRSDVWDATLTMIKEHYVYGVGFGGFQYGVSQFADIAGDVVPKQAHNDYLELVASGGLISTVLFAWFLCMVLFGAKRAVEETVDLPGAWIGSVCGIAGVAFQSQADFGLQYIGNWSFFIALIAIVISPPVRGPAEKRSPAVNTLPAFSLALALSIGFLFSATAAAFGISRYLVSTSPAETVASVPFGVPFDAEYHAANADRLSGRGDSSAAAASMRTAIDLRSRDYRLYLRLACLESESGDIVAADHALRSAISLAPLYGEPHFLYGNFLLETQRNIEGINELVFAARRDPRYTEAVLELIWGRTTYMPEYLDYLTADGYYKTVESVRNFLLRKDEYELLVALACTAEFSETDRDMLVRQLFERQAFHDAGLVYHRQCQQDVVLPAQFLDGDFETATLKKGTGFGWILGEALTGSRIAVDRATRARGEQSLHFTFDGKGGSSFLKQTLLVRKGSRYKVSFFCKTSGVVSGGAPVVQVLSREPKGSIRIAEAELTTRRPEWERRTLSFQANDRTEAIEVILTTRPCGDAICPIFGEMWVDDFEINES